MYVNSSKIAEIGGCSRFGQTPRNPGNVAGVAIRQLTTGEAVFAGGRARAEEHPSPVPWIHAPDGAGLAEQLADIDLL